MFNGVSELAAIFVLNITEWYAGQARKTLGYGDSLGFAFALCKSGIRGGKDVHLGFNPWEDK